jgi:predicted TIM-barrel fold metal-dependent hydrolase
MIMSEFKYQIIDMHAHIFPDKVASRAVESIGSYYNIPMSGPGTVGGLLESGRRIGVSKYVVHSSATNVDQVVTINDYVSGVVSANSEMIGFGTLHPGLADADAEVTRLIGLGLKGIKLHPEFQRFVIDDEDMLPIYRAIKGRLPVLIHMGDENRDSSSPVRLARILDMFPDLVVIAAHFGGYRMWDESMQYLVGRNLYMDTSSALAFLSPEKAVRMIRQHGVPKMFFGSDYPMWDHEEELGRFLGLDLTEDERKAILFGNAKHFIDSLC